VIAEELPRLAQWREASLANARRFTARAMAEKYLCAYKAALSA
jgi:hypothetical protein